MGSVKEPVPTGFPRMQAEMHPQPHSLMQDYKPSGKLQDRVALITGGDSGIGRAVAVLYAREGANIAINFLPEEQKDASETKHLIDNLGRKCILLPGDLRSSKTCNELIDKVVQTFGRIDVLVNNAGYYMARPSLNDLSDAELERTFATNVFAKFYLTRAALPHMRPGSSIINTAALAAYHPVCKYVDYCSSNGAIISLTRALAADLIERGIRVNAVAPGPTYTPQMSNEKEVKEQTANMPLHRLAQPEEVAPAFVYLASIESSYVVGQTIHAHSLPLNA